MRLLGLAPGGVCLAASIAARAGGLLHHRFTLTSPRERGAAICLSVALAVGLPRLAVSQHRALWSADFPQPVTCTDRDHPVDLGTPIIRRSSHYMKIATMALGDNNGAMFFNNPLLDSLAFDKKFIDHIRSTPHVWKFT